MPNRPRSPLSLSDALKSAPGMPIYMHRAALPSLLAVVAGRSPPFAAVPGGVEVLDLHTAVATTLNQVPTVNSQLIVRSELLELPYLDLCARITEEAEENPALEVELDPLPLEHAGLAGEWQEGSDQAGAGAEERSSWGDPASRVPAEHTLRDDLRWRVGCLADAQERRIAEYLIESIDERGYVTTTVFDAALELDVSEQEVEAALERLQSLGPPGVGARDLRECLLLQLATFAREPAHVREVIAHCAQAVERGGWARLSRTLGLDEQELAQALEFIRESLHPYPGEQFRPPGSTSSPLMQRRPALCPRPRCSPTTASSRSSWPPRAISECG